MRSLPIRILVTRTLQLVPWLGEDYFNTVGFKFFTEHRFGKPKNQLMLDFIRSPKSTENLNLWMSPPTMLANW